MESMPESEVPMTPESADVKQKIIENLSQGLINESSEIIQKYSVSEAIISSPEVQEAAKLGMIRHLSKVDIDIYGALEIKHNFPISHGIISSPELQEAVKRGMIRCLSKVDIDIYGALLIKHNFPISHEIISSPELQEAVKAGIINCLAGHQHESAVKLKQVFFVSDAVISSPEVQEAAKIFLMDWLNNDPKDLFSSVIRTDAALEIIQEFFVPDATVQEVAKQAIVKYLSRGIKVALEIRNKLSLSDAVISSSEVQTAACDAMIDCLYDKNIDNALEIKEKFAISDKLITTHKVQNAVMLCMYEDLSNEEVDRAFIAKERFLISDEIAQEATAKAIIQFLHKGRTDPVLAIKRKFSIPERIFQESAKSAMIELITDGQMFTVISAWDDLSLPADILLEAANQALVLSVSQGNVDNSLKIMKQFSISDDIIQTAEIQDAARQGIIGCLNGFRLYVNNIYRIKSTFAVSDEEIPAIMIWLEFYNDAAIPLNIRHSFEAASFAAYAEELIIAFDPEVLSARLTHRLSPREYRDISVINSDCLKLDDKGKYDMESVAELMESDENIIPDENIRRMLALGRKVFGAQSMIDYSSRPDMARHDELYFMPAIIALQEQSGLSPDKFSGNILLQVARDNSFYEEGNAHHRFATICQSLSGLDVAERLNLAKRYSEVAKLQDLVRVLESGAGVFSSWKMLKKFHELNQLLERSEILEDLNDREMSPKLRNFIENLAFHPNISLHNVIQFWREPAKFLEIDDEHADAQVNAVKKPANYISLPFLGLSAENLRDAYVEGTLDKLQTLPAMERVYKNMGIDEDKNPNTAKGLHAYLVKAMGRRSEGIKGDAKDTKKLFHELNKFCKTKSLQLQDLVDPQKGPALIAELTVESQTVLRDLIFAKNTGMAKPDDGDTYRIRIGAKSDPAMVVAGNDTASCMPFGSGKNNVYMFNPNCVQLVLERQLADGSWRTAAQSVVTIDIKTSKPTPELIDGYKQHKSLQDLIESKDFANQPVITCDNIEVAKNEEGERVKVISETYAKFFAEYLAEHAEALNLDPTRVIVGAGYTPASLGLPKEPNTYVPLAPMSYSDNIQEDCYVIETGFKPIKSPPRQKIRTLKTTDAMAAAYIEGKAYHDNDSLLEYLHKIQNNIIGKEIADKFHDRPNLSFIATDERGVPQAYIISYEGVIGNERLPQIYIADLAADPQNKLAAPALVRTMIRTYFENYGTQERPFVPIFTNAREKTSYQWILKLAESTARRYGAVVTIEEQETYNVGGETMHNVRIYIGKNSDSLQKQQREYGPITEPGAENYPDEYRDGYQEDYDDMDNLAPENE